MCDQNVEVVMLHQDTLAAAYQDQEYRLLGMAIKYAGLRGKEVHIIGENRATLKRDEASNGQDQQIEKARAALEKYRGAACGSCVELLVGSLGSW